MRIPSTSDLCQAHSNRAYDKMEVISDHIHELMDLYEWIFNLRAYLASLLAGYVTIGTDQTITGKKTFENLKAHVLNIANATEVLNEGYITTGYYNDSDPALIIHFTAYDDDVPYETRLYLVSQPGGNPYFVIPPTNADDDHSAVRLDYLNSILSTLNDGSDGLADRISALENKMNEIYPFDTEPTDGSTKGVTSGGVFDAIQSAINNIDFPETVFPVATTEQKGIMQVGEYLTVNNGLVGVDADALATYIRSQLNIDSSISGNLLTYSSVELEVTSGANIYDAEHQHFYPANGSEDGLPVDSSDTTKAYLGSNSGNGNVYLNPKPDTAASSVIGVTNVKCTNLSTGSSNYYIPLRTVIILTGLDIYLQSNQGGFAKLNTWTVKCWFRNRDYTLTSEDKIEINDQANALLATRIPTGTYPNPNANEHTDDDRVSIRPAGSQSAVVTGAGYYIISDDLYYDTGDLT